jgi:hypothetical protein
MSQVVVGVVMGCLVCGFGVCTRGVPLGFVRGGLWGDPAIENMPLGETPMCGAPVDWAVSFSGRDRQERWKFPCGAQPNMCSSGLRETEINLMGCNFRFGRCDPLRLDSKVMLVKSSQFGLG